MEAGREYPSSQKEGRRFDPASATWPSVASFVFELLFSKSPGFRGEGLYGLGFRVYTV